MSTPSPRPRASLGLRAALAALAVLPVSSCNVAGAKAYNLRQLHDDRGRHMRIAQTMGDFRYLVNSELSGTTISVGSAEPKDARVKDPLKECVHTLIELGDLNQADPSTASVQVQMFAWLAVDDPWQISRTVCVRQLGSLGQRLGIEIVPRGTTPTAGVEEVRDALAQLVRAVRIETGREEGDRETALRAACERIDGLALDRDGALRMLRAVALLEKGAPRRSEAWEPLRATMVQLQRVCIREALLLALHDDPPREVGGTHPGWNNPRVRAMAVTACIRTFGPTALGEMLGQLEREPEPLVLQAVLRQVAKHGLPTELPGIDAATLQQLHRGWTTLIFKRATQDPNGPVRVTAMRALATISGGALTSLREEDWLAWMRDMALMPGTESAPGAPPRPELAPPEPPAEPPSGTGGERTR